MSTATLLVELLTEELPPKSLAKLAEAFRDILLEDLREGGFVTGAGIGKACATPRRLAVLVSNVPGLAPDRAVELTGPSVKAPRQAIEGFARKNGVAAADLVQIDTPKGKVHACRKTLAGASLDAVLAGKVEAALKRLPVAKMMRWGDGDAQFVRPVHGLVMLHGTRTLPGSVLGIASGNRTRGHRFMGKAEIVLGSADDYEQRLREDGMVIADFAARRAGIDAALLAEAKRQDAVLGSYQDLLDEVTALVEHASIYAGAFDPAFLDVPPECLILTMRQNQKYFPLFDAAGRLLPKFLIVSNMQVADPRHIVAGNQRVVRPRLEDARFFYDQDRKVRLESRVPQLAKVVHHNKLGSQLDRVMRVQQLAGAIAAQLGANRAHAERAAWLAKADLLSGMVGEFPELQGVMGRYYALHDGEPAEVADAIEAHYRPRFAGDRLPEGATACAVALADKLDALTGFFGAGEQPTGEKDPFGLRRAALGVVRILVERDLPLRLDAPLGGMQTEVAEFIFDRLEGYLRDSGYSASEVAAVLSLRPAEIHQVLRQLEAVRAFAALPEAANLAAANKRIGNILKKGASVNAAVDPGLLAEPQEKALHAAIGLAGRAAQACFEARDYRGYLVALAGLRSPVDAFFDTVLVNAGDAAVRANRFTLLRDLQLLMNRFADISRLAA